MPEDPLLVLIIIVVAFIPNKVARKNWSTYGTLEVRPIRRTDARRSRLMSTRR